MFQHEFYHFFTIFRAMRRHNRSPKLLRTSGTRPRLPRTYYSRSIDIHLRLLIRRMALRRQLSSQLALLIRIIANAPCRPRPVHPQEQIRRVMDHVCSPSIKLSVRRCNTFASHPNLFKMRYSMKCSLALPILAQLWLTASALPAKQHKPPVCIIGAGPAGLTAAQKLEAKGIEAVVFEKQDAVGGKCQSYYNEQ